MIRALLIIAAIIATPTQAEVLTPELSAALLSLRGAHVKLSDRTIWIYKSITSQPASCVILHTAKPLTTLNQLGFEFHDFNIVELAPIAGLTERECFGQKP